MVSDKLETFYIIVNIIANSDKYPTLKIKLFANVIIMQIQILMEPCIELKMMFIGN